MEKENFKQTNKIVRGRPFQKGHKINVGRICSKKTREKLSEKSKGKPGKKHTKKWKKWFSKWLTENHPNRKEKIKKICEVCKKEFFVQPCYNSRKFCSKECFYKSQIGRKLSENQKKKYSKTLKQLWASGQRKGGWKISKISKRMLVAKERKQQKERNKKIKIELKLEEQFSKEEEKRKIKSLLPKCQQCGIILRKHNKIKTCRKHRHFSSVWKQQRLDYRNSHKKEIKELQNEYAKKHRKEKQTYDQKYRKLHAKRIDTRVWSWRKKRLAEDPIFRMKQNLKSRTYRIFKRKSIKKPKHCKELLGAEFEIIKNHIEKQFTKGMTWDNYGKWHVDHIIPLAIAKTVEELIKLCHYTNLQPLWAIDNLRKGIKVKNRP